MNNSSFIDNARQLIEAGRQLHAQGWVPATSGNFSMRLDSKSAIVTASGRHKGFLTADDFLAVDLQGQSISSGKPSAETLLHTQLYQRFAEVGAVLHCHSPNSTVLSRLLDGQSELVLKGYELLKAFEGIDTHDTSLRIPIFENTQDIAALAAEVEQRFSEQGDFPAYIIRGHGVYCWRGDMAGCLRQLEALEFLLHCELQQLPHRRET